MKKNTKKFSSLIAVIFAALLIGITILSNNTDSEHYSAGNSKEEITETDKGSADPSKKDTAEDDKETENSSKEEPSTDWTEDIFAGYTLIEVDGGDLSGHREPNVVVDIGFGDREYYAFTNEYGQLVKVIAKEIILQDDSKEPVTSSGRYYRDEAKVPGVESKNLDEGHVIADSLGGVSNAYNITPQNSTLNRHGDQAYMEKVIRDAGGCTDFVAIITYPNTTTQIPSHYSYTYTIKGNVIKDEFDNINPDEYNASLESNTSTSNSNSSSNTTAPAENSSSGSNTTTTVDNSNTSSNAGSTSTAGTVYWTPNGKSYHTTKDCSTLSRSKTILEGTLEESGKSDPCDRCH
ncbi:DNA/RNA non-specific endonuclease [Clostridium culturomicium]|uniref:DNA/RNA non-specific endonuclease n=1 Tax=Clostridium culturomicium TaxID=1499683 RepID=UPI0009DFA8CF|nr:DNA/RNA non-specific endonuclease [Clostridium culturomicium]